jgi:hypothetical protein
MEAQGQGTDGEVDCGRHHDRQEPKSGYMSEQNVTVTVPFAIRKRGERTLVTRP